MTLTFNLREKMFQTALLLLKDNCAKLFRNSCINVQVMAPTSSIYDHFDLYLTPVILTFTLPEKNVSNGTSSPRGQQLCKIILKSMDKCTSYGQAQYMTILTFICPCDLDLQPTQKYFKWQFFSRATTVPNCFKVHALLYKLWSEQIRTDAQTYTEQKL